MSQIAETTVISVKSHGLLIEYLTESDFLSILKEGQSPDTLNLPTQNNWCVIRYTHIPLQAVGYFVTATSAWLPKITAALTSRQDELHEGVAEFFEDLLKQRNQKLLEDLIKQQKASCEAEVSEKNFRASPTTTTRPDEAHAH